MICSCINETIYQAKNEGVMKNQMLIMSICFILFSGCSSSKDVYEYEFVSQSEAKSVEGSSPAPEETTPSAQHSEGGDENVEKPADAKPVEKSSPVPVAQYGGITTKDPGAKEAMDAALKALGKP